MAPSHPSEITCAELVELVTAYLEGALPAEDRLRFEQHLVMCEGCVTYLDQMRETIRLAGRLGEKHLDDGARDALLHAFRTWATE
jgi:anti-sigma factor RsiW